MTRLFSTAVVILALLAAVGGASAAGDVKAGKAKSATCAVCHGANGEGSVKGAVTYAALAGMNEGQMVQDLQDFKSGKRPGPTMKPLMILLTGEDMGNLAAYYASLK
jgi:cytochrome c553